jgi:hypothetical protein
MSRAGCVENEFHVDSLYYHLDNVLCCDWKEIVMIWKYKLEIRQYLTEDSSKKSQIAAAKGITGEVKKLPDPLRINGLYLCVELMKAAKTGKIEWFNASLSKLWDWFDDEKIWVEW